MAQLAREPLVTALAAAVNAAASIADVLSGASALVHRQQEIVSDVLADVADARFAYVLRDRSAVLVGRADG